MTVVTIVIKHDQEIKLGGIEKIKKKQRGVLYLKSETYFIVRF